MNQERAGALNGRPLIVIIIMRAMALNFSKENKRRKKKFSNIKIIIHREKENNENNVPCHAV